MALGLYYLPSSVNTYGKMIQSCIEAGYNQDYAKNEHNKILEIDSLTDRDWRDLNNLLPLLIRKAKVWLEKHPGDTDTKDMRQVWTGMRLIGDSVGKFIKREERVTHNIEEKRAVIIYGTPQEHAKAIKEKIAVLSSQLIEIDGKSKESG